MSYIFFWGHSPTDPYSEFSQWYPCPFVENGVVFPTAEHYMMYHKALLFDPSLASAILQAGHPSEAKALGRQLKGFSREKWDPVCDQVVEQGNYLKFSQNPAAKKVLLETRGSGLVEASPEDRIWGIGYGAHDALENKDNWGENRLVNGDITKAECLKGSPRMGLALTRARERLLKEETETEK
ncbi:hypothetical protein P7C73_g1297, partial [Tremellales sp. Uapishka_1]